MRCTHPISVVAFTFLLLAAPAARADHDVAAVPDVEGRTATQAHQILDGAGFVVRKVDIAEGTPGVVVSQVPPAGRHQAIGSEVEIRVGTALRIQTQAPDVRGRDVNEAVAELATAYVVEIESVDGPEEERGTVVGQEPEAGAEMLLRGLLRLFVVEDPPVAGVTVPEVIGKTEGQARHMLEDDGLKVAVTYVEDPGFAPGTVVYQDPPCCGEIIVGGLVALRVVGEPTEEIEAAQVPMPAVVGLSMNEGSQTVLLAGLVPHVEFEVAAAQNAWTAIAQDPPAGTMVDAGASVTVVIGLPAQMPAQVRVPPLYGLTAQDAKAVLDLVHLSAAVDVKPSLLAPGRVFAQTPASGTWVPAGSQVVVAVATKPPGGWSPTGVLVPDVTGLPPGQAFAQLVLAGLWGKVKHHVSPGAPLGVVDAQHPSAGGVTAPGTIVTLYVPHATKVPALLGLKKAQAVAALSAAGLNAVAQGPAFGLGSTKVTGQSHPAGSKVAKGTAITFTFVHLGGPGLQKVKVPHLIGKTKAQAIAALQAKGLNANLVGPAVGLGTTKVTAQNIAPNTLVLVGTTVTAQYVYTGGVVVKVPVPNVVGKTKAQAAAALQAAGLQPQFQGPAAGIPPTKVTAQNPAPQTLVNPNSKVVVQYVFTGNLQPVKIPVPGVVGMTKAQAGQALQAKGLQANYLGPAQGLGIPKAVAQHPAAGALVFPGSTVNVTIQYQGLALKVKVPDLAGLTKAQALAALEAKGLKANFQGPQVGFGTTKVVGQNPAAGTLVNPGATVTVTYVFSAGGKLPILKTTVPNVVGKHRLQAKAIIESKGLVASFQGPLFGTVKSQDPVAGKKVAPGSTVKMVIQ